MAIADPPFDFDRLPDLIFVEILRHLGLRQQIAIARVNRRFQKISRYTVSMTKHFRLDEELSIITNKQLRRLIGKFARNLRSINYLHQRPMKVAAGFEYPRLVEFEMEGWIDRAAKILRRCPNVRRVKISLGQCQNSTSDILDNVVLPNVDRIDWDLREPNLLDSLINACPNIRKIKVGHMHHVVADRLEQLFADRADFMEAVILYGFYWDYDGWSPLHHDFSSNIWRLRSLQTLVVKNRSHNRPIYSPDLVLERISDSFTKLRVLHLTYPCLHNRRQISRLSKLKHLTDLRLDWHMLDGRIYWHTHYKDDNEAGINEFVSKSESEHLRKVRITEVYELSTIKTFVDRFRYLEEFRVDRVLPSYSVGNLAEFVRSIRDFDQVRLQITIGYVSRWAIESRRVRRAIEEVRKSAKTRSRLFELKLEMSEVDVAEENRPLDFVPRMWRQVKILYYRYFG